MAFGNVLFVVQEVFWVIFAVELFFRLFRGEIFNVLFPVFGVKPFVGETFKAFYFVRGEEFQSKKQEWI